MTYQTEVLASHFAELIVSTYGEHTSFDSICGFESAVANSLIFVQELSQYRSSNTTPAVIVTNEHIGNELSNTFHGFIVCVSNVKLAQALVKQHFDDYQAQDLEWPAIHDSAVIHEKTKLGLNCRIGANVTIGANCKIGDNVIIRANAVVEHDVTIGSDSIINSLVNIGYSCVLGKRVILQAGCIIGAEGYGFANDDKGNHHRIPHTGNVVLHDDVQIGSNSCIDRGTYGSTIIKNGVKIDNLCHIAHNVEIGENSLLTAQCCIAGSSVIGKRVIMSGQAGVLDHKTIPDDTVLVLRAGVTENLAHGGMWAGTPAKPFKEFVRDTTVTKKVRRLEDEIKQLKKLISK